MKRVKKITGDALYLTFDDGPDSQGTPQVLKTLARHQMKATFFVVAERARHERGLLQEILAQGHSIGNHSLDHRYGSFFRGKKAMMEWMQKSEDLLTEWTGKSTIGFRPPAGVITPELIFAANSLKIPLILWNVRFFDKIISWRKARAISSLASTRPGSIILLHDSQSPKKLPLFIETLSAYSEAGNQLNLKFAPLTRELCMKEALS